jgi:hypothetical protein
MAAGILAVAASIECALAAHDGRRFMLRNINPSNSFGRVLSPSSLAL